MTHEFWYLSRAAGLAAYLLLFVSVALGLAVSTRAADRFFKRGVVFDLHRFTTILALGLSVFHVLILLGDGYFNFSIWQLAVPFLSPYRSWQTAVGIFSIYALALIVLSFYIRRFIGFRTWRTLHYLTFALYAAATLHGITAGTDTAQVWATWMYIGTGAAVGGLFIYRLQHVVPADTSVRLMRIAAGGAVGVIALVFLLGSGLFENSGAPTTAADTLAPASASLPGSFQDQITGTFNQTSGGSSGSFSLEGTATGDLPLRLKVNLTFQGNSAIANAAQVLDSVTANPICDGTVTDLGPASLSLTCSGAGRYAGASLEIAIRVRTDGRGNFSGQLTGQSVVG